MRKNISRREFIKTSAMGITAVAVYRFIPTGEQAYANESVKQAGKGKILIAYFSHSGNTRYMAGQIHERIGGDMLEIRTVTPYSQDYDTVVEQAKQEQNMNAKPKLATRIPDLSSYDTIFVGYPNWWGTMPMALFTFFEKNDLSGKTLIPFSTHEGSRFGRSVSDMKRLNPQSNFLEGLAVQGRSVRSKSAQEDIQEWLANLNEVQTRS